jgi:catechol 2,3-dioxygenase-like lactoylglutathione lyase family enzyme
MSNQPTTSSTTSSTTAVIRTPALVSGLNHVAVMTDDLDRVATFYVDVFDAELIETPAPPGSRATTVRLSATAGLTFLEVTGNPHGAGSTEMLGRGHLDHVALEAPGGAELEEVRRRLVAKRASTGEVNDYGAMVSVYFVDPDGMGCEICWIRDPTFAELHAPVPFTGSLADA